MLSNDLLHRAHTVAKAAYGVKHFDGLRIVTQSFVIATSTILQLKTEAGGEFRTAQAQPSHRFHNVGRGIRTGKFRLPSFTNEPSRRPSALPDKGGAR